MEMEGPVIWPTWCYSGDVNTTRDASSNGDISMPGSRHRKKESNHESSADIHQLTVNYSADTINNNVKFERLSPGTTDTSSRSATPSSLSHPNTPPAEAAALQLTCRNYSEFMRSLASKYQNASTNEYLTRGDFPAAFDPRLKTPGFALFKEELARTKEFTPPIVLNPFSNAVLPPPMIDMSSTQMLVAMLRTAKETEFKGLLKHVKRAEASSPLDLSAAAAAVAPPSKRTRIQTPTMSKTGGNAGSSPQVDSLTGVEDGHCHNSVYGEDVFSWSVEDVCAFVASIDTCAEYVQNFKAERIDGSSLPLLTEDHLTSTIHMKLGPALKLRAMLAKKMCSCSICLHCIHCHNQITSSTSAANASTTSTSATTTTAAQPECNTDVAPT